VESLYLDYFSFVEAKEELKRDHLMTEAVRKGETRTDPSGRPLELCDITPEGEIVSAASSGSSFPHTRLSEQRGSRLEPQGARRCERYRKLRSRYGRRLQSAPDAYGRGPRNGRSLSFRADEDAAQKMCRQWKESTAGIYTSLLASLNPDQRS
jgi:hypothetical protein